MRSGPIQGDMEHPYLRQRRKEQPVVYQSEELKVVFERTSNGRYRATRLSLQPAGPDRSVTVGRRSPIRPLNGASRRSLTDPFQPVASVCFQHV